MNADPRLVGAMLRSDFYSFIRATFPIVSPSSAFAPNWQILLQKYFARLSA